MEYKFLSSDSPCREEGGGAYCGESEQSLQPLASSLLPSTPPPYTDKYLPFPLYPFTLKSYTFPLRSPIYSTPSSSVVLYTVHLPPP